MRSWPSDSQEEQDEVLENAERHREMVAKGLLPKPKKAADPDREETEEDGIRAEAIRRLKVRRQLQMQRDRMPTSSPSQKTMPDRSG